MSNGVDDTGAGARGELTRIGKQEVTGLAGVDLRNLMLEVWDRVRRDPPPKLNVELLSIGDAISERLADLVDRHLNRFSRTRAFDLFGMFQDGIPPPRPPIQGATYLDLGCGGVNPYGFGAMMLALGAAQCTSIDLDSIEDHPRAVRAVGRLIDHMLRDPSSVVRGYPITRDQIDRNASCLDRKAVANGDAAGLRDRLRYLQRSAYDTSMPTGSVDVVVSNSFLEHVDDVPALLREMSRVTKPGGFGVHAIDGIDHWSYGDPARGPHDFLCEPTPGMYHGSNRIRPLEFPALFEQHGFSVQNVIERHTTPMPPAIRARLVPPWSTLSQRVLEATYITLVVRRK